MSTLARNTTGSSGIRGEVEIRRSSVVISADGHRVVLEDGHRWGRHEVAIPIDAVHQVETDHITLGLTKDEAGAIPSAEAARR